MAKALPEAQLKAKQDLSKMCDIIDAILACLIPNP